MNTPPPRLLFALGVFLLVACGSDSTAPAGPLSVTAVNAPSGPLAGGTSVTITGTNFVDVASVTIGGSELVSRAIVSTTKITGTTSAAGILGSKDVVVTSSNHGSGTCSGCFSYVSIRGAAIAAGGGHTCGLASTGEASCWGRGGSLGNGSLVNSSTPVAVSGGRIFSALAAGGGHACALTNSGTAYCWGANSSGQAGNYPASDVPPSTSTITTPVLVSGGLTFSALTAGGAHTCGLASALAFCWGWDLFGQLGGSPTSGNFSSTPQFVSGISSLVALTAGVFHTCGLTSTGAAYCWGDNETRQLGNGSTIFNIVTPVAVSGGLTFSVLGASHTPAGSQAPGRPIAGAAISHGQLGTGSTTDSSIPVAVSGGLSFSALATGGNHVCGLTSSGTAYCWGDNQFGQLGDGSITNNATPVAVSGGLTFRTLAAGGRHTCGLTSSGNA